MSDNYIRSKRGDRFILSTAGGSYAPMGLDSDLGTGPGKQSWYFNSAMEREHFVEVRELRRDIANLQGRLESANRMIDWVTQTIGSREAIQNAMNPIREWEE